MRLVATLVCAVFVAPLMLGTPGPAAIAHAAATSVESRALLSRADKRTFRLAFSAGHRNNWRRAFRYARKGRDPLATKVLRWFHMTRPGARVSFSEITEFIEANPDWPSQDNLARRAEEAMTDRLPKDRILAWLKKHPPLTTDGGVMLGAALIATGRKTEGAAVIRNTWVEGDFGRRQERNFLRRYRKLLRGEDHWDRLDRLLWDGKFRQARRTMNRVPSGEAKLARARMALRLYRGGVDWALRRVPEGLKRDPGLLYERLKWRRRKDRIDDAVEILLNPPRDLIRPEKWWSERAAMVRPLLARGRVADAYRIVREHQLSTGANFAEAEWLAGWIALRFLNKPREALGYFQRLYRAVRFPISRARAAYWAGRAPEVANDHAAARQWYGRAAALGNTFYGQLAAERTDPAAATAVTASDNETEPAPEAIRRFEAREETRIVRILDQLGEEKLVRRFMTRLARLSDDAEHQTLVGRLALSINRRDLAVRVARHAYRKGVHLPSLAYPVIAMPDGRPERGLLLAVARQESNLYAKAKSGAGALGLMQLMPRTARAVARDLRVRYSRSRLTRDPDYNIRLGRAYLRELLKRFDGSYVLSIAAYNAGPNAVRRWIRNLGDPRAVDFNAIDWIEMIPYRETRNYVQRVMENLQVYRRKLSEKNLAYSLESDLAR